MKYIKPLIENILFSSEQTLLADSLVAGDNPVSDAVEGATEGWGDWN